MFHTVHDRQTEVEIDVYQGESDDVRRNHRVGTFRIEGLAPVPAGNPIVVQLDLNLDGILKVSAKEKATGLQKQMTIENALTKGLADHDASAARIEQLWRDSFPEEAESDELDEEFDDEGEAMSGETVERVGDGPQAAVPVLDVGPREGQREAVQARAMIEKAERLRERASPEDQAELDRLTRDVRAALEDRNWAALQASGDALADVLFYLEDA